MIALLDFGIRKVIIEYDSTKAPYKNKFTFEVSDNDIIFFQIWIDCTRQYHHSSFKLDAFLDDKKLLGIFPIEIEQWKCQVTIAIDHIETIEEVLPFPPAPPAPPSRIIGAGRNVEIQNEQNRLEYETKLSKYHHEMQKYNSHKKL